MTLASPASSSVLLRPFPFGSFTSDEEEDTGGSEVLRWEVTSPCADTILTELSIVNPIACPLAIPGSTDMSSSVDSECKEICPSICHAERSASRNGAGMRSSTNQPWRQEHRFEEWLLALQSLASQTPFSCLVSLLPCLHARGLAVRLEQLKMTMRARRLRAEMASLRVMGGIESRVEEFQWMCLGRACHLWCMERQRATLDRMTLAGYPLAGQGRPPTV